MSPSAALKDTYRLIYFPVYCRGEPSRMLLAHSGATWYDEVISGDDFAQRKAANEFPNGQLPVLVINDKYYNESLSILRFLGKKFGYYSDNADEAWFIDATVDYVNDFLSVTYPVFYNEEFGDDKYTEFTQRIQKFASHLDKQL